MRTHLNGPMVARLRKCAAGTSPNWDEKITIYPPEARELIALIDEAPDLDQIGTQIREALDIAYDDADRTPHRPIGAATCLVCDMALDHEVHEEQGGAVTRPSLSEGGADRA